MRADAMQRLLTENENSKLGSEIRVSCRGEGRRASTSKGGMVHHGCHLTTGSSVLAVFRKRGPSPSVTVFHG